MIEHASLAIIIDCWDTDRVVPKKLYKRIVNFLDASPHITTVALASYNCRLEKLGDSIWYQNYNNLFSNSQSRKIKDLEYVHRHFEMRDTTYPNESTAPIILNYINNNKVQLAMKWRWELEYYLDLNPEIQNVYVIGTAWDMCVKIRPLGYESVKEIKNINVLTNVSCVIDMQGNTPVPSPPWQQINNSIYHYE